MEELKPVGQIIAEAREKKGISKNQLAELAGISHTEIARIESGERELPNPRVLRKISKYIDVNYNDLMYAAGLGFQVTPLNPFLKCYYDDLRGDELQSALVNTIGSKENWEALVKSFKKRIETEELLDSEREIMENTIQDTEYQINAANEIIKLLQSAMVRERITNDKKNKK